jgi:hypothetical protein
MPDGWTFVEGELELDGMPVGWALQDGWKLAEGALELDGIPLGWALALGSFHGLRVEGDQIKIRL